MSKIKKQFDFTKFKQRHIALKILYFGWDYDGLASQLENENTIEFHLFQALIRTCLVESRDKCNYNRCGRTDKGVSSYGQVVDLNIRSNLVDENNPQNIGLFTPGGYTGETGIDGERREIRYVEILNRVLPDHIKVIAWSPVLREFSSRFSCQSRSYSYIFPLGDLCIESMKEALSHLIGEHDFRNLCSFDLKNGVTNHNRTILSAHIKCISSSNGANSGVITPNDADNKYSFYEIVIVGQAFLYHQIRCIMTILFLVGTRKESPNLVRDLLDIEKCPARPNYNRASPMPLCLFACKYSPCDLPLGWIYDIRVLCNLVRQLKHLWMQYKTKSMMIERVLLDLESILKNGPTSGSSSEDHDVMQPKVRHIELTSWKDFGLECDNMSDEKYKSLMKRPRDETLESKLEVIEMKKRKKEEELLKSNSC